MTKTMKNVMIGDLRDLGEMMGMIPEWMAEKYDDLKRASDYFFSGDRYEAFKAILEKGLQEFLDMCDLDDKLVETETQMQQPNNGLVTAFNRGFFGD